MATKTKRTATNESTAATAEETAPSEATNGQLTSFPESAMELKVRFKTYPAGKYGHEELGLSVDDVLAMYRNMLLQRRFEQRAGQMYGKQEIAGFLHLYIGQEAISTGTATAIQIGQDSVITAYRDHGHGLALGMSANECMAELFGRVDGCSGGKGGSMHYFSKKQGLFGGHGIVGAHVPVAVGIAFAHKYRETGGICVGFYGDGAAAQGAVHEASNLAGLYDLPAILVVENNQYAMGTAIHRAFSETEFTRQAFGYDLPASLVNGMDVFAVTKAVQDHAVMAREFQPSMLEIRTYRYRGHSMSDPQKYRTKEELLAHKEDDPILRLKAYLIEQDLADVAALDAVNEDVKEEVLASVAFAEKSPRPDLSAIYDHIYEEGDYPFIGR
jgi:pyruvate dehydrogenase E1 component subunit alpha